MFMVGCECVSPFTHSHDVPLPQLADLQRTLICTGAAFFILSHENEATEAAAATLLGGVKPLRLTRGFGLGFSRRPYAFRLAYRKSTLVTVSLPDSVCEVITAYASFRNASRNQVYNKCLQQGLLVYLKTMKTVLGGTEAEGQRATTQSWLGCGRSHRSVRCPVAPLAILQCLLLPPSDADMIVRTFQSLSETL